MAVVRVTMERVTIDRGAPFASVDFLLSPGRHRMNGAHEFREWWEPMRLRSWMERDS